MSILKVLPLMYLVVKTSALWLPRLDPLHVKENNENCLCPTESPTIINSLDSDHSGVERLVVFVYKKPNTGEIVSFIPQKEHQRKIPDFPDTYGHIHNIDQNPSIREIFEISPSKDIREHKTYIEPVPQHNINEDKENIVVHKIPKDFNEQHSYTEIKIPEWHMSHDKNKVKPESIDSYPLHISEENDDKKPEIMINDIDMKIPKWQMQINKNKVIPENNHKITKTIIDGIDMKIPEWPMQLDGIKVKPEHFISQPNDYKNTEIMIDNIGMKIPEWPMQLDEIKVKPEHFILNPNDKKNTEIMIDNIGTKIPKWPMQLDRIKIKPEHFISQPNDHKNRQIMLDNINMKIPEMPMQLDGIKVEPEHLISYPKNHKNTEIKIDDIGMKIPQWQMQIDQKTVKPEHFISNPQHISGQDDHKKTNIVIDTDINIPKWQMQLDENEVIPEPFISYPNGQKNTEIIIDETGVQKPELEMEPDENKVNPAQIISQLIPGGNDDIKTEIVIDDIKPPTQDVSSELIHVSEENNPNSHETYHAPVKPLRNNDISLDDSSSSIDSTLIDSLEPQDLFAESNSEHTLPGGIETIWHKEPLDEPNHSIHIRHPPIEKFRFPVDQEVKFPAFRRMKVPRRDKFGRIIGWTFKTIKTYWKGGSRIPNHWDKFRTDQYKPFNYNYHYIEDPAFDHWLREQLRITTLNGNRIPSSTADIIALDRAIRNVLLQNGWIVTGEGTLIDGSGKMSSLDNLKLRPILVGKPFSYDRLMKQSTHEYKASSNIPYLEGLLLTMIKPAKILGIVPLSITPHKHHSEAGVQGRSSKDQQSLLRVLPIEELVSFRKDTHKTKKPQDSTKNKSEKSQISSRNKSQDAALLRQALSEIQPQYAKGSLTTLKQGKGQVKHRDFGIYGTHRIITPEMPEWRIIGGNSATSSGTPLEWKGRSGLNG
ncbi:uncharacterized protein LOC133525092 [Cydia pomonella]|uniref:uncharacterized protein LOC133525092 n=1 Tax=Cydia pomonella TaxID=82600 RepID=UPI002ADE2C10|nr:uncharacterized protein LOC133525092 [Cydia pomonella]